MFPSRFNSPAVGGALAAAACVLTFVGFASGQVDPRSLQPVEPGIGDLGPLTTSTRLLPIDLRQPAAFERVFRVPGSSRGIGTLAPGAADDRFARVNGAITAVFPRSEYFETKNGIRAAVPSGTIFYIGGSPLMAPAPFVGRDLSMYAASNLVPLQVSMLALDGSGAPAGGVLDLRVRPAEDANGGRGTPELRPDQPAPAENIFVDEQFRRARVRQLLSIGPE